MLLHLEKGAHYFFTRDSVRKSSFVVSNMRISVKYEQASIEFMESNKR